MERSRLNIGILTSSRADFGIYQNLLRKLAEYPEFFLVELIVFGTHLSKFHGYTKLEIEDETHFKMHTVHGMPLSDEPEAIANAYGNLVSSFSHFWARNTFDWVLALGDRYEMAAAVQAGIPFELKVAHLHGGETTLGAIDNIYRHQISLASKLHFTATDLFAKRVREITLSQDVYTVGSLSLTDINHLKLPSWDSVKKRFDIQVEEYILCTIHPETVGFNSNEQHAIQFEMAIKEIIEFISVVISLPNADTYASIYREMFSNLKEQYPDRIYLVESFGRLNYFAAIKQSKVVIGNSSSAIIEVASLKKYAVNIGDRQLGRPQSSNIINSAFDKTKIIEAIKKALTLGEYCGENIYYKEKTDELIVKYLMNATI